MARIQARRAVIVKSSSENMTVIPGIKSKVLNFYTCIDLIKKYRLPNCNKLVVYYSTWLSSIWQFLRLLIMIVTFFLKIIGEIISLIETSQSIGGAKREYPGKPPDTPASRTCLVSHVASSGFEPTPDTAVR